MIERQIVASNVKELKIQEYITGQLKNLGHSHIKLQKTPLGEKIIIHASRPGLIVGRKGQNIKKLTEDLKSQFSLDNPQIEINEVEKPDLDAQIVAERIAGSLEKFGTQRFKGVGHKVMADVMNAGALGIEILITGKIPSSRSKRWRFYNGYLKKCGEIATTGVRKAYTAAQIKTGTVGIQVRIMTPDIKLPDHVEFTEELSKVSEEVKKEIKKESKKESKTEEKKPAEKKKEAPKKKPKAPAKKAEPSEENKPVDEKPVKAEPEPAKAEEAPVAAEKPVEEKAEPAEEPKTE